MSVVTANEPVLPRESVAGQTDGQAERSEPRRTPHERAKPCPTGGATGEPSWTPPTRAIRRVDAERDSIELDGVHARVRELARALAGRIRERPLVALAAAIGVGFLVGGALTFRAGRIALAAAARHVARELLKQVL